MATFSEPIQPSSVSFVLADSSNTPVPASVSYNSSTNTITLTPNADLTGSRTYTASISGARDLSGIAMSQPVVWSFSTALPGFLESVMISGLDSPTAFQFASDGRVFVAQKDGRILVFQSLTDGNPTLFADLRTNVHNFGNRGLLGMALDPNFPSVPYVYVFYAYDAPIGGAAPAWGSPGGKEDPCPQAGGSCVVSGRLSRLQANGNVMTGTEQVLINDWYQQYPGQPVGNLAFGPDGNLYAAAGDGASSTFVDYGQTDSASPDPVNEGGALRSQDLRTPADPVTLDGSIIRVHSDTGQPVRKTSSMTIASPTVDANGVKSYLVTSLYQGPEPTIIRVFEPTNPVAGKPRRFLYVLPVGSGVSDQSSAWSDGLEVLRLLDVPNRFNMTLIAPSFNYEPWYGDNITDPNYRMESFILNDLVPFGDTFAQGTDMPQRFLVGFSKSGNGALFLILRHPNVFSAAAAWDSPAQLNDLSSFSALPMNFGTQANYDLYNIPSLIVSNAHAFQTQNRLWVSGDQAAWTEDMIQLHQQLTAAGIRHTWVQSGVRNHSWNSGWLDGAVTALDANATPTAPVDANDQRIIAYGLRSPRVTFRPGTPEIWVADRGWNRWEEINRILDATTGSVENFGWPCYEGSATTGYSAFSICSLLYSDTTATTPPYFAYDDQSKVIPGDETGVGSGAISGLAFYDTGNYPDQYQGALFFSDAVRNQIWVMYKGSDGLPDPANLGSFLLGAASPTDLKTGPGGDLFYADPNGGTIRRISFAKPVSRSNGQPTGILSAGIAQATLSLNTDQNATCRFATAAGTAYASMANTFAVTGTTTHSSNLSGLVAGNTYTFYVRCEGAHGNTNVDDFVIGFSVAKAGDSTPPVRSNGQPAGTLAAGTTQTSLGLTTDENATCRYATTAGVAYASMPNTFSSTGGITHATLVSGLTNGGNYSYYVRCQDASGNANTDDFAITFSVGAGTTGGSGSAATSSFSGTEDPLFENGMWDTPGSWTSLHKNNGVYSTNTFSAARLVTPVVGADQYAEITYDQDPGSASWPGVLTRVQSAGNGSGYLAIAYAGQVRLYRADDNGSLNFPSLASANVNVGTAPRRLRLESQGNVHRIYFNGTLMLTYTDSTYTSGQPGIADSVFGGPTVRILSFAGGTLGGS
jgi:glucose/arabinose dehydrogenase